MTTPTTEYIEYAWEKPRQPLATAARVGPVTPRRPFRRIGSATCRAFRRSTKLPPHSAQDRDILRELPEVAVLRAL